MWVLVAIGTLNDILVTLSRAGSPPCAIFFLFSLIISKSSGMAKVQVRSWDFFSKTTLTLIPAKRYRNHGDETVNNGGCTYVARVSRSGKNKQKVVLLEEGFVTIALSHIGTF